MRDAFVVRSEHRAEAGRDHVEVGVPVRKLLAVADVDLHVEPLLCRELARPIGERRREVDARDLGTPPGCAERKSARSAGDVEPALAALRRQSVDEIVVRRRCGLADPLERTVPPHHRLPLLQLIEAHYVSSSFALDVSWLRARQSEGKKLWWIIFPSTSTGVPCVPTTWSPMIRATTL